MTRFKILFSLSLIAILSVLFTAVLCLDLRPVPTPAPAVPAVPAVQGDPIMSTVDGLPNLPRCGAEDGGPILPCYRERNTDGRYNVFAAPMVTRAATVTIHTSRLVNCEDHDVQPCWTLDNGALVIVFSYAPYSGRTVKVCPSKGASPLPCLARRSNARTAGDPTTRNYAWAGHL